jgi:hypothetical protein
MSAAAFGICGFLEKAKIRVTFRFTASLAIWSRSTSGSLAVVGMTKVRFFVPYGTPMVAAGKNQSPRRGLQAGPPVFSGTGVRDWGSRSARNDGNERTRSSSRHCQGPTVAGAFEHRDHPALRSPQNAARGQPDVQGCVLRYRPQSKRPQSEPEMAACTVSYSPSDPHETHVAVKK